MDSHRQAVTTVTDVSYFTRPHLVSALSKIGITNLLKPLTSLYYNKINQNKLTSIRVGYSAWNLMRLLMYGACTTSSTSSSSLSSKKESESNSPQVSSSQLYEEGTDELINALVDHLEEQVHQTLSDDQKVGDVLDVLSLCESSLAFHPLSNLNSATTAASDRQRYVLQAIRLMHRCCQAKTLGDRIINSHFWMAFLIDQALRWYDLDYIVTDTIGSALLCRISAIRLLKQILPTVTPASLPINSQTFIDSILIYIGQSSLQRLTHNAVPKAVLAHGVIASEYVALMRTLLAASSWSELLNTLFTNHIDSLRLIRADDELTTEEELKVRAKTLANVFGSLWICGGGNSALYEGGRVSGWYSGQYRIGTIIRTVSTAIVRPSTDVSDDNWNDALYEVLLDAADRIDDTINDENSLNGKSSKPSKADSAVNVGKSTDATKNDVVYFFASTLTPIDTVDVPLSVIVPVSAQVIVYAIGTYLRATETDGESGFITPPTNGHDFADIADTDQIKVDIKAFDTTSDASTLLPFPSMTIDVASDQLVWADVKMRAIKTLNVLLQREDIAGLVLQQGLAPLLVPLALTPLASITGYSPLDESSPSITELESRAYRLAVKMMHFKSETNEARLHRITDWVLEDKRIADEEAAKQAELEAASRMSLSSPPITLLDPRHPHPLVFYHQPVYESRKFVCDLCQIVYDQQAVYHCPLCRWDACIQCEQDLIRQMQQTTLATEIVTDIHPHPLCLTTSVYDTGLYNCDRCGQDNAGAAYHCDLCKYDMCTKCAKHYIADTTDGNSTNTGSQENEPKDKTDDNELIISQSMDNSNDENESKTMRHNPLTKRNVFNA